MKNNYTTLSNSKITKKQLRKKKLFQIRCTICMTILFISIISILSVFPAKAKTTTNSQVNSCKYYKSIQIKKGDSLWSIAKENMDYEHYSTVKAYLNEIKTSNSITSNTIIAGAYIIIPYYSSETNN